MKHTPGPWTVRKTDRPFYSSIGGAYFIHGPEKEYVARLTDEAGDREANARLIAAAPELFEVIQKFVAALNTNYSASTMNYEFGAEARRILTRIEGGD